MKPKVKEITRTYFLNCHFKSASAKIGMLSALKDIVKYPVFYWKQKYFLEKPYRGKRYNSVRIMSFFFNVQMSKSEFAKHVFKADDKNDSVYFILAAKNLFGSKETFMLGDTRDFRKKEDIEEEIEKMRELINLKDKRRENISF